MKIYIKQIFSLLIIGIFLVSASTQVLGIKTQIKINKDEATSLISESAIIVSSSNSPIEDFDPLVDLELTFTVKEIRALDKIDLIGDPDFYVKVFINDEVFESPVWKNQKYVQEEWSITTDVPDNEDNVSIKIQLWDWNIGLDKLCDLNENYESKPNCSDIRIIYDLKTGHWRGEDELNLDVSDWDPSGYGRLNGCDDNSIYENDRDCELIFDITQNDYDGDGIPYWTEVNAFGTDPEYDDSGNDTDNDGVPIEWEWKWGYYLQQHWHGPPQHIWIYNPFEWEDHKNMDFDEDGLDNVEEYLTSQWGSDPYRQDVFLEIDQMEIGPNGEGISLPDGFKDLLRDSFSKHNIVFQVDDGCFGGGEFYPFDDEVDNDELQEIYWNYFMHNDENNWRRGAFHYGIITYRAERYPGFAFGSNVNGDQRADCFQISTNMHEDMPFEHPFFSILKRQKINREKQRQIVYAGAMMHETGHIFGIFGGNPPGCDDQRSVFPRENWLKFRGYKSCMNYNYAYYLVDYSDGSRGKNDNDDWGQIDLARFQYGWH